MLCRLPPLNPTTHVEVTGCPVGLHTLASLAFLSNVQVSLAVGSGVSRACSKRCYVLACMNLLHSAVKLTNMEVSLVGLF